jgi:hypothetical protein
MQNGWPNRNHHGTIKTIGRKPAGPRPKQPARMGTDYFVIVDGAGPVEGMLPVPDLPLAGPPGSLAMVGVLFGLFWSVWVPELLVPPAPPMEEPEPDTDEPELVDEPEP